MDPGHLIAINIILLYAILGPLVLFAIYVLFDSIAKSGESESSEQNSTADKGDPALWADEDINAHLNRM